MITMTIKTMMTITMAIKSPGSLSWDARGKWSAQPAVDLDVNLKHHIIGISSLAMPSLLISVNDIIFDITSTASGRWREPSISITPAIIFAITHIMIVDNSLHIHYIFISSSDNYIESAVRGDNLNFHLVIDIEWVSLILSGCS